MSDVVDTAQVAVDQQIIVALKRQQARYAASVGNESRQCIECEDVIDADRLKALPGARRCRDCQQYLELRGST